MLLTALTFTCICRVDCFSVSLHCTLSENKGPAAVIHSCVLVPSSFWPFSPNACHLCHRRIWCPEPRTVCSDQGKGQLDCCLPVITTLITVEECFSSVHTRVYLCVHVPLCSYIRLRWPVKLEPAKNPQVFSHEMISGEVSQISPCKFTFDLLGLGLYTFLLNFLHFLAN